MATLTPASLRPAGTPLDTTTTIIMNTTNESIHHAPKRHDACQKVRGNDTPARKASRGKIATTHETTYDFGPGEFQEDADAWEPEIYWLDPLEGLEPSTEAYEFWNKEDDTAGGEQCQPELSPQSHPKSIAS